MTIGFFMFAMGIGSFVSKWFHEGLISSFIAIEIIVALIGGFCSSLLFLMFPYHAMYQPVMFGLIIVIGTLVGLEIPLLARILSRSTAWKESIANVLSLNFRFWKVSTQLQDLARKCDSGSGLFDCGFTCVGAIDKIRRKPNVRRQGNLPETDSLSTNRRY
jgi:hypothetical protein